MQTAKHFEGWALGCPPHSYLYISYIFNESQFAVFQMANYMQIRAAIRMQIATHFEGWALGCPRHSSLYK